MRLTQTIEDGKAVGFGHVYVDSHYYDDDDSEEDDYYDHDCHYNPKNKTRECMGEDEIRTVLKLLNAGVKRLHFCVRKIQKISKLIFSFTILRNCGRRTAKTLKWMSRKATGRS